MSNSLTVVYRHNIEIKQQTSPVSAIKSYVYMCVCLCQKCKNSLNQGFKLVNFSHMIVLRMFCFVGGFALMLFFFAVMMQCNDEPAPSKLNSSSVVKSFSKWDYFKGKGDAATVISIQISVNNFIVVFSLRNAGELGYAIWDAVWALTLGLATHLSEPHAELTAKERWKKKAESDGETRLWITRHS